MSATIGATEFSDFVLLMHNDLVIGGRFPSEESFVRLQALFAVLRARLEEKTRKDAA